MPPVAQHELAAGTRPPRWSPSRPTTSPSAWSPLEAQATGTPVVAAAVGGLTTVVRDGHSGLLVDEPRAARLGRGAAPGRPTTTLRLRLEGGALEQARRFSWERTAERTLDVYRRAQAELRQAV